MGWALRRGISGEGEATRPEGLLNDEAFPRSPKLGVSKQFNSFDHPSKSEQWIPKYNNHKQPPDFIDGFRWKKSSNPTRGRFSSR